MSNPEVKPRAREGLLAADHSKRGRRFVTILDPSAQQVTLLEAWEHAILVLSDGRRTITEIADLLAPSVDGVTIDREVVHRCLKFFERQGLIFSLGLRSSDLPPPGPVTLTQMQQAFQEWHREPMRTGQILSPGNLPPPFPGTGARVPAGLEPTVALPGDEEEHPVQVGQTLVLAGVNSLLDDGDADTGDLEEGEEEGGDMLDLLAAVDSAVAEADALEAEKKRKKQDRRRRVDTGEVQLAESRPMKSGVHEKPKTKIEIAPEFSPSPKTGQVTRPSFRPAAEAILRPTTVGLPPEPPKSEALKTEPQVVDLKVAPAPEPVRVADLLGADVTETETIHAHGIPPPKKKPEKQGRKDRPNSPKRMKSEPTDRFSHPKPKSDLDDEAPTQLGKMVGPDER